MASVKIILYKHKTLKDGTHPIMIQIIHNTIAKRKAIGISSTKDDWNEEFSLVKASHPHASAVNEKIHSLKSKLQKGMNWFEYQNIPFSTERLLKKIDTGFKSVKLMECLQTKIDLLNNLDKIGTRNTYIDTKNALLSFVGTKKLLLQDIDVLFLKSFESHLSKRGCKGGIRIYMECIRSLYNDAISLDNISSEFYPFARSKSEKHKYNVSRLRSEARPKGLSLEDRNKWKSFDFEVNKPLRLTYDLYNFSYYSRGMNFKDIAHLRWKDVYNGRIYYQRKKTKAFIDITISVPIKEILNQFSIKDDDDYIFPILKKGKHISEQQKYDRIKKCLRKTNRELKQIASIVGIKIKVTFYVARHSYVMALLEGGETEGVIGRSLGHAPGNGKVLQHYLGKLDSSVYDTVNRHL